MLTWVKFFIRITFLLLVFFIILDFSLSNNQWIEIVISGLGTYQLKLSFIVIIAFCSGVFCGCIMMAGKVVRLYLKRNTLKRKIHKEN